MLKTENKDLLKFNAEGVDPYEMWTNAKKACLDTVNEYTAKHGEPMYCGFANVKVYPARGKFIKFLKEMGIGSSDTKVVGEYLIMILCQKIMSIVELNQWTSKKLAVMLSQML